MIKYNRAMIFKLIFCRICSTKYLLLGSPSGKKGNSEVALLRRKALGVMEVTVLKKTCRPLLNL